MLEAKHENHTSNGQPTASDQSQSSVHRHPGWPRDRDSAERPPRGRHAGEHYESAGRHCAGPGQRTRESKVSTGCLGKQREGHNWWPVGTELVGKIGSETFMAVVIDNPAVKSGRSVRITSGQAAGRICLTPTRAAIEATEDYRQAHHMGRGGGITNGWEFWSPKA